MCYFAITDYECGDWKWGNIIETCPRKHRLGEPCGTKSIHQDHVSKGSDACKVCQDIKVKRRRLLKVEDSIRRWTPERNRFAASLGNARTERDELISRIKVLHSRRQSVLFGGQYHSDGVSASSSHRGNGLTNTNLSWAPDRIQSSLMPDHYLDRKTSGHYWEHPLHGRSNDNSASSPGRQGIPMVAIQTMQTGTPHDMTPAPFSSREGVNLVVVPTRTNLHLRETHDTVIAQEYATTSDERRADRIADRFTMKTTRDSTMSASSKRSSSSRKNIEIGCSYEPRAAKPPTTAAWRQDTLPRVARTIEIDLSLPIARLSLEGPASASTTLSHQLLIVKCAKSPKVLPLDSENLGRTGGLNKTLIRRIRKDLRLSVTKLIFKLPTMPMQRFALLAILMDPILREDYASVATSSRDGNAFATRSIFRLTTTDLQIFSCMKRAEDNLHLCITRSSSSIVVDAGLALLYFAVLRDRTDVVSWLAQAGTDVNKRDQCTGLTPLQYAVMTSSPNMVRTLITSGATADVKDNVARNHPRLRWVDRVVSALTQCTEVDASSLADSDGNSMVAHRNKRKHTSSADDARLPIPESRRSAFQPYPEGFNSLGDEDDQRKKRRKGPTKQGTTTVRRDGLEFACPYSKFDPGVWSHVRACGLQGYDTVPRLKDHLKEKHRIYSCERCGLSSMKSRSQLNDHIATNHCSRLKKPQRNHSAGYNTRQADKIEQRWRGQGAPAKWRKIYKILFELSEDHAVPSPYFESRAQLQYERQRLWEALREALIPHLSPEELTLRMETFMLEIRRDFAQEQGQDQSQHSSMINEIPTEDEVIDLSNTSLLTRSFATSEDFNETLLYQGPRSGLGLSCYGANFHDRGRLQADFKDECNS